MAEQSEKKTKAVTSAQEVASYIISFAHDHGSSVTNLKLQKLLYYAQGWHLAFYNGPLFNDRIEAWVYGPVVPSVYHKYQKYSYKEINEDVEYPQFDTPDNNYLKDFLDEFLGEFIVLDAFEMERMTHKEPPWLQARGDLPPDAISTDEISIDVMDEYFKQLALDG